jgi:hypothetical protein
LEDNTLESDKPCTGQPQGRPAQALDRAVLTTFLW